MNIIYIQRINTDQGAKCTAAHASAFLQIECAVLLIFPGNGERDIGFGQNFYELIVNSFGAGSHTAGTGADQNLVGLLGQFFSSFLLVGLKFF